MSGVFFKRLQDLKEGTVTAQVLSPESEERRKTG
jgi:hypothetical protein